MSSEELTAGVAELKVADVPVEGTNEESSTVAQQTADGEKSDEKPVKQEIPASVQEGRRVYFGSVDFKVHKGDFAPFLEGFEYEDVIVPLKVTQYGNQLRKRPLGIAFVDFKTKEEAERAVAELNGKELLGRAVRTEIARPYDAEAAKKRKEARKAANLAAKKEKAKAKQAEKSVTEKTDSATSQSNGSSESSESSSGPKKDRKPRRQKKDLKDGVPSKDTIYITSLDYKITEADLLQIFADYNPVWASVPRKFVNKRTLELLKKKDIPIRGRGFGFVRFSSEEMQQKAIKDFNGTTIADRTITVQVAIDMEPSKQAKSEPEEGESGGSSTESKPESTPESESATQQEAPEAEASQE